MNIVHGKMIADKIKNNFNELEPALTNYEAIEESNRCLYCYDAPCIKACPTSIDIPKFIKKIASGNLKGSALQFYRQIHLVQAVYEFVQQRNFVKGHVF